jgi:plasmid stabilization system protein ParE
VPLELIVRPEAEEDLTAAFDWYEERVPGLGPQFLDAVEAAFRSLLQNPLQFPVVYKTLRRALLRRFPYQIFFLVEAHAVIVVAVFHASRSPKRWMKRSE